MIGGRHWKQTLSAPRIDPTAAALSRDAADDIGVVLQLLCPAMVHAHASQVQYHIRDIGTVCERPSMSP